MPQLPTYTAQIGNAPALPANATPEDFGAGVAAAGRGFARSVAQAGDLVLRHKEQAEVSRVQADIARSRAALTAALLDAERSAVPGDEEWSFRFLEQASDQLNKITENITTRAGKSAFDQLSTNLLSDMSVRAGAAQAQMARDKAKAEYLETIKQYGNALQDDPSQFDSVVKEALVALAVNDRIPIAIREELARQTREELALNAVRGTGRLMPMLAAQQLGEGQWDAYIDPDKKAVLTAQFISKADEENRHAESLAKRQRDAKANEMLSEAYSRADAGSLDRDFVEQTRPFVSPTEYKGLLKMLRGETVSVDDPAAFAVVESLMYTDPEEAHKLALTYHRSDRLTNATMSSMRARAHSLMRQMGPVTEYERSRQFIVDALKPGEFVRDPAAQARAALAIRAYDDFSHFTQRTDDELRKEADRLLRHFSLVEMTDLARQTGIGSRDPNRVLLDVARKFEALQQARDNRKISEAEFARQAELLNQQRKAAEAALNANP